MIPTIGIIGGIGSGKSVVARAMELLGGHRIDADRFGHEALAQSDIKAHLVTHWGDAILDEKGNADRKKIGRIVFSNPNDLRTLESLVFPFIENKIRDEIARARSDPRVKFIILDAAIMLETGWHRHCDQIVFVDAPREIRLARLQHTRGWDEAELVRREKTQAPLDEKKRHADAVIVNDSDFENVNRQVKDALEHWKVIC